MDTRAYDKLLQKLERLRGSPIDIMDFDAWIAGHEESDVSCLCKRPLVSVIMTVYNHEPYIRDAIEGIVNQQCDF